MGGGGTAAARSLVDDINAALSAVSGGGGLPQETHGARDGNVVIWWAVQCYHLRQGLQACGWPSSLGLVARGWQADLFHADDNSSAAPGAP